MSVHVGVVNHSSELGFSTRLDRHSRRSGCRLRRKTDILSVINVANERDFEHAIVGQHARAEYDEAQSLRDRECGCFAYKTENKKVQTVKFFVPATTEPDPSLPPVLTTFEFDRMN